MAAQTSPPARLPAASTVLLTEADVLVEAAPSARLARGEPPVPLPLLHDGAAATAFAAAGAFAALPVPLRSPPTAHLAPRPPLLGAFVAEHNALVLASRTPATAMTLDLSAGGAMLEVAQELLADARAALVGEVTRRRDVRRGPTVAPLFGLHVRQCGDTPHIGSIALVTDTATARWHTYRDWMAMVGEAALSAMDPWRRLAFTLRLLANTTDALWRLHAAGIVHGEVALSRVRIVEVPAHMLGPMPPSATHDDAMSVSGVGALLTGGGVPSYWALAATLRSLSGADAMGEPVDVAASDARAGLIALDAGLGGLGDGPAAPCRVRGPDGVTAEAVWMVAPEVAHVSAAGIIGAAAAGDDPSARFALCGPADIYAWSMLAFEALSGTCPFQSQLQALGAAFLLDAPAALAGTPPLRPDLALLPVTVSQPLRDLLARCWAPNPATRPRIDAVHNAIVEAIAAVEAIPPGTPTPPPAPAAGPAPVTVGEAAAAPRSRASTADADSAAAAIGSPAPAPSIGEASISHAAELASTALHHAPSSEGGGEGDAVQVAALTHVRVATATAATQAPADDKAASSESGGGAASAEGAGAVTTDALVATAVAAAREPATYPLPQALYTAPSMAGAQWALEAEKERLSIHVADVPMDADAHVLLAALLSPEERVFMVDGEEAGKRDLLRRAIAQNRACGAAYGMLGMLVAPGERLWLDGEAERGKLELLATGVDAAPHLPLPYVHLAVAMTAAGIPGVSLAGRPMMSPRDLLLAALRVDPRLPEPYLHLALQLDPLVVAAPAGGGAGGGGLGERVTLPDGRTLDAMALCLEALRLRPTYAHAYVALEQVLGTLAAAVREAHPPTAAPVAALPPALAALQSPAAPCITLPDGRVVSRLQLLITALRLDPGCAPAYVALIEHMRAGAATTVSLDGDDDGTMALVRSSSAGASGAGALPPQRLSYEQLLLTMVRHCPRSGYAHAMLAAALPPGQALRVPRPAPLPHPITIVGFSGAAEASAVASDPGIAMNRCELLVTALQLDPSLGWAYPMLAVELPPPPAEAMALVGDAAAPYCVRIPASVPSPLEEPMAVASMPALTRIGVLVAGLRHGAPLVPTLILLSDSLNEAPDAAVPLPMASAAMNRVAMMLRAVTAEPTSLPAWQRLLAWMPDGAPLRMPESDRTLTKAQVGKIVERLTAAATRAGAIAGSGTGV